LTYLMLKRALVSRPSGEWNDDDFDMLADGALVGRILKVNAAPIENTVDVDAGLLVSRRSHAEAWICRHP
jgi:hypothetical protein